MKRSSDEADAGKESITLENALKIDRPVMGTSVPVTLYRLVRLVALEDMIGRASALTYMTGKRLGKALGLPDIRSLQQMFHDMSIGRVAIAQQAADELYLDVYECVACSGLEPVGRKLCAFEGGLIAGIVESIVQRRVTATEVTCIGGLGQASCGYHLALEEPGSLKAT